MADSERKMGRCFMNGKSCIYERDIDERLSSRDSSSEKKAFVIMPFGDQLDVLYQWEIAPFLENGGKDPGDPEFRCTPERADDVRQVGFIICEKICRKIQEADYIVVDVTYDNPNVFYELGLAAALRKKIVPICAKGRHVERKGQLEQPLGMTDLLPYPQFDMLQATIKDFVWPVSDIYADFGQMRGDEIAILHDLNHKVIGSTGDQYDFGAFCKTAVGTAAAEIFSQENKQRSPELELYGEGRVKSIRSPKSVDPALTSLGEVIKACKSAACVLVDVSSKKAICNFFWLGYIHGIGGNAIPVNSYPRDLADTQLPTPFDIRALWHVAFRDDHPSDLLISLRQIFEHIYIGKARNFNREEFWKDILEHNKVSIVLGSLYLDDLGRNTIGDWDYRTAAEITSYLSTSKETMKVTLESPLPKREKAMGPPDEGYIDWLKSQLQENTIIVGSGDVNDLTEVALCSVLGREPFKRIPKTDTQFKGYIAYKKYAKKAEQLFPDMAFYVREKADKDSRGFLIQEGNSTKRLTKPHSYPGGGQSSGIKTLLGQLVVAKNPFADNKWIVIISGISGPATLGIAQMLTGCIYKEFTVNNLKPIPPEVAARGPIHEGDDNTPKDDDRRTYDHLSEQMLTSLLKTAGDSEGEVNALIEVDVYYPPKDDSTYSNDERKIIEWRFADVSACIGHSWANPNDLKCKS
ncbi:MAG: hypothetical protein ACYS8Z_08475 [Planctomycetota bacterium]